MPTVSAPSSSTLQFGHGRGAVENVRAHAPQAPHPHGFNSATAGVPWRTERDIVNLQDLHGLQFGHGRGAVENTVSALKAAFLTSASIRPRQGCRGEHLPL